MTYLGDRAVDSVINAKFTTDVGGAPITLVGGAPAIYKDGSLIQTTTGVTLTIDFDGIVGLHHIEIDQSADPTTFATGSAFWALLSAGTVDGVSQVGRILVEWSLGLSPIVPAPTAQQIADAVWLDDLTTYSELTIGSPLAYQRLDAKVSDAGGASVNDIWAYDMGAYFPGPGTVPAADVLAGAYSALHEFVPIGPDDYNIVERIPTSLVNGLMQTRVMEADPSVIAAIWDWLTADIGTVGSIGQVLKDMFDKVTATQATIGTPATGSIASDIGWARTDISNLGQQVALVPDNLFAYEVANLIQPGSIGALLALCLTGPISGVPTLVWAYSTRTLTSGGGGGGGATAAEVWAYATRVLTSIGSTVVQVTQATAVNGDLTIFQGDTYDSDDGAGHGFQWQSSDPVLQLAGVATFYVYNAKSGAEISSRVIVPTLISGTTYLLDAGLTSEETALLLVGKKRYKINVVYVTPADGDDDDPLLDHTNTLVNVTLTVKDRKKA